MFQMLEDRDRAGDSGFTLLELLAVLAIMATLAAVVSPLVFRHVGDARIQAARSQIEIFSLALDSYYADTGAYPTTEEGLRVLREPPSGELQSRRWRGPYLRRPVPVDPWGRAYVYLSPGVNEPSSYDLSSLGRDGQEGGEGEDADITSWGAIQP